MATAGEQAIGAGGDSCDGSGQLDEIPARVEMVLSIVDQLQDAVSIVSCFILLGQVEFSALFDGRTLFIRN